MNSDLQGLKPGDRLRVITPSGALRELDAFQKGIEIWRSHGYHIDFSSGWDGCWGYLAGTDEARRFQLLDALKDDSCRGILCTRGGYGSTRLLEGWHENLTEISPKFLIGFSDITALLWGFSNHPQISGVHGPVLTTLAQEPDWSIQRLFDWVERLSFKPLLGKGWGGGKVTGRLFPGNLTVATHLLGTRYQPELTDVILAFEDVHEEPYRIDRMLTYWRMVGVLERVQGIALGRFSQCETGLSRSSFKVEEVLRDRLGNLGIPVVSDLPFGHDGANAVLPVGMIAELDADQGTLSVKEGRGQRAEGRRENL